MRREFPGAIIGTCQAMAGWNRVDLGMWRWGIAACGICGGVESCRFGYAVAWNRVVFGVRWRGIVPFWVCGVGNHGRKAPWLLKSGVERHA